jgi:hypothetical protein
VANMTASPPPGTFSTSPLSPIYVGGMPLDDLVTALAVNAELNASQKQTAENSFWSTPQRNSTDTMREVLEVSLTTAKQINAVAFELARFPHKAYLFYFDAKAKKWLPALNTSKRPVVISITDSIPYNITPTPLGSPSHAQHYGAGHWVAHELAVLPFTSAKMRLVLVRQKTNRIPIDNSKRPIPYSLGVRGFNVGFKVKGYVDIPRANRDPVIVTERESFTSTTDMLGSPIQISVRENRATDLLRGALWKCEPQPVPNAVVNLYVNARDSSGQAQVVDRFMIDPITTGVAMNIYFSNDTPDEVNFAANDNPLSFPLVRTTGTGGDVTPQSSGLMFPNRVAYVDIDNAGIQFNSALPFWLGMVIRPQFDVSDTTPHVLLDTGTLRLEWTGSAFMATYGQTMLMSDDIVFSFNERLSFVMAYDGDSFHLYTPGEDRDHSTPAIPLGSNPTTTTGMTSLVRLGGLITLDDSDPGYGNYSLASLILKSEVPPGAAVYDQYFSDPAGFVVEAQFAGDDLGTTDNAILRYDPSFQTPGASSINPLGIIGGPSNRYQDLIWTPVTRDYKLNKGYCVFNPIKAKYFKFEFTNLAAQPYDDYEPVVRTVQVFPTAKYYPSIAVRSATASGNTASGGTTVSQDAANTMHFADQVRLYTNIQTVTAKGTYTPTQALFSQNPLVQGRLRADSLYFNLQKWHLSKFCPRFVEVQKHVYEHIEIRHTQRLAYFVGINSIQMIRVDYAADDDTEIYLESFQDATNFAHDLDGNPVSGWMLGDDDASVVGGFIATPDQMGLNDLISTESKTFASQRKVTGLQFATQQSPATQILDDSDFDDVTIRSWRPFGDVLPLEVATEFTSDIGSMVLVQRDSTANYWSIIEERWNSWDAIEDSDPDPYKPIWDDLEIQPGSSTVGGIETSRSYSMSSMGRLYAAARVYTTKTLSAPLFIQIVDMNGNVISEAPYLPEAGQVSEWFTSYTVGEGGDVVRLTWQQIEDGGLIPDGDPTHPTWDEMEAMGSWDMIDVTSTFLVGDVTVRLAQMEPTNDSWYVDNISTFDDGIVWQFSNDGGKTWHEVYDIRNDPNGCFMFPHSDDVNAGFGLRWRVTGAKAWQRVNYLAIRPFYDSLPLGQPYRETIQALGPNQAMVDHYCAVSDDPRWKLWHKPIPEDWWFTFRQWLLQQRPDLGDKTTQRIVLTDAIVPVDEGSPPSAIPIFLPDDLVWREPPTTLTIFAPVFDTIDGYLANP